MAELPYTLSYNIVSEYKGWWLITYLKKGPLNADNTFFLTQQLVNHLKNKLWVRCFAHSDTADGT